MAKFCINCGKTLKENEVCGCKKEVVSTTDATVYFGKVLELIKGMFISPIETMKGFYKQTNLILANILIVAGSVIFGIFVTLLCKETVGGIFESLSSISAFTSSSAVVEFPYFRVFITSAVMCAVTYYLLTLVLQLFIKSAFKKNVEYKNILNLFATISLFITIATLISLILVFISLYLVFGLLLVSLILVIICLTFALKEIVGLTDMKVIYTIVGSLLIVILVNWLVMPKLFM